MGVVVVIAVDPDQSEVSDCVALNSYLNLYLRIGTPGGG
jgi:hypothetical protein